MGVCGICTHVAEVDICCVSECAFTVCVVPTHVLGVVVGVVSAHTCGRGWTLSLYVRTPPCMVAALVDGWSWCVCVRPGTCACTCMQYLLSVQVSPVCAHPWGCGGCTGV